MASKEATVTGSNAAAITDTTSTDIIAAISTARVVITNINVANSHATVGTVVKILDGTTEKYRVYVAPVTGNVSVALGSPLVGTKNTAWKAQPVTTGSSIYVSLAGYAEQQL